MGAAVLAVGPSVLLAYFRRREGTVRHSPSFLGQAETPACGCLLGVGAVGLWHSTIVCGRGRKLPSCASRRVVGFGWILLRALLLLGVMIGWRGAGW